MLEVLQMFLFSFKSYRRKSFLVNLTFCAVVLLFSACSLVTAKCQDSSNNLTDGYHCDQCMKGYWGNPVNGGKCQPCECEKQATQCHPETGKCFCTTKGRIGGHCEKCDTMNNYHSDPINKECYYGLFVDYVFTFDLSKEKDRHYSQINFQMSPPKADIDVDFMITCSVWAKMNITVRRGSSKEEKPIYTDYNCTTFKSKFIKSEYNFGMEDNVALTTFHVYVYDLQPPLWIKIYFAQPPKLNLQQTFIGLLSLSHQRSRSSRDRRSRSSSNLITKI